MSFSFAITAYQEMQPARQHGQNLLRCIRWAQMCEYISEIVIVDDCSSDFEQLKALLDSKNPFGITKVRLYTNSVNLGVFGNKLEAIAHCSKDWVITCDSDNLMDAGYLSFITNYVKCPHTWYCPSFARPKFDYRTLVGGYTLGTITEIIDKPMFGCCMNTGNQTVHRKRFMEVFYPYRGPRADLSMPNWLNVPWEERRTDKWKDVFNANDSFIFNLLWLQAGNSIEIVKGLEYEHYYTSGNESNYVRAPKEKEQLNHALMNYLRQQIKGATII